MCAGVDKARQGRLGTRRRHAQGAQRASDGCGRGVACGPSRRLRPLAFPHLHLLHQRRHWVGKRHVHGCRRRYVELAALPDACAAGPPDSRRHRPIMSDSNAGWKMRARADDHRLLADSVRRPAARVPRRQRPAPARTRDRLGNGDGGKALKGGARAAQLDRVLVRQRQQRALGLPAAGAMAPAAASAAASAVASALAGMRIQTQAHGVGLLYQAQAQAKHSLNVEKHNDGGRQYWGLPTDAARQLPVQVQQAQRACSAEPT